MSQLFWVRRLTSGSMDRSKLEYFSWESKNTNSLFSKISFIIHTKHTSSINIKSKKYYCKFIASNVNSANSNCLLHQGLKCQLFRWKTVKTICAGFILYRFKIVSIISYQTGFNCANGGATHFNVSIHSFLIHGGVIRFCRTLDEQLSRNSGKFQGTRSSGKFATE